MKKQECLTLHAYEAILSEAIRPIASELRGFDAADLIAFARLEREASLAALVASAADFYYRPGHFRISGASDVRVDWNSTPEICLKLVFRHDGIEVYFDLVLGSKEGSLAIDYINYQTAGGADVLPPLKLQRSLDDCRLLVEQTALN